MERIEIAAAWAAVQACGRDHRGLRARLRWIAGLLAAYRGRLSAGAWLLADSESNAAPPIAALGAARAVRCGSNPVCEVCLHGRGVAAQHAEITLRSDGVVWLGLLEGREATWVNGVPVAGQTALNSGDVLQLGAVRLALVIAS